MNYNVIAIECEYASGGSEIGGELAARLGIPCYDKEVLEKAVVRIGMSVSELENLEEFMTGSFLYGIAMLANINSGDGSGLNDAQRLSLAESDVVRNFSLAPCVIVSRSATAVLRDDNKALKVFIRADYETRKERAIRIYQNDPKQTDTILNRYDKRRAAYYKATAGEDWKNPNLYHMILDSGKLGINGVVELLYNCAK